MMRDFTRGVMATIWLLIVTDVAMAAWMAVRGDFVLAVMMALSATVCLAAWSQYRR